MKTTANADQVRELVLYTENTSEIYHRHTVPTVRNLAKFYTKGNFDESKALKAFEHVATASARAYVKEFCEAGAEYHRIFTKADRVQASKELLAIHREHIDGRNPL